jgi:hypothetical protein
MTLISMNDLFKDMSPQPGSRLKQWVVDTRREDAWERETCPRFPVPEHEDNTGAVCRNSHDRVPWTYLNHDCCEYCNDECERLRSEPQVQAWLIARSERPPIEQDRSKYSDEVQPDYPAMKHPMLSHTPTDSAAPPSGTPPGGNTPAQ